MKKVGIFILSLIALGFFIKPSIGASNFIQEILSTGISFDSKKHDFGDIIQGESVSHIFKYTNENFEPLILTNVKASCGCTTPNWSRAPLMKGKSAELKVVFNSSGKSNGFQKEILVHSNLGVDTLVISGNIIAPK